MQRQTQLTYHIGLAHTTDTGPLKGRFALVISGGGSRAVCYDAGVVAAWWACPLPVALDAVEDAAHLFYHPHGGELFRGYVEKAVAEYRAAIICLYPVIVE